MSISARFLRFIGIAFLLLVITPTITFAQSPQRQFQEAQQTSKQIEVLLTGFSGTLICTLSGIDIFNPGYNCLGQKMIGESKVPYSQINTQSLGAIGLLSSGIGAVYQKPINSEESVKYLADNFGIAKKTLAQSAPEGASGGFQSFSFVQNMFLVLRNISFLLLVFVFILIGIAVMLRFKIDPRTVMTLQNQIPKIIIAIVMITFSFSIAGLLVDGMWAVTYFGINTIGGIAQNDCGNPLDDGTTFAGVATRQILNNPVSFTSHVFKDAGCFGKLSGIGGIAKDIGASMSSGITDAILTTLDFGPKADLNCGTGFHVWKFGSSGSPGDCLQEAAYAVINFLIGIVAFLIILIAIIVALIRLWITLVKAYVYIILDVITAPLQILVGVLPGGKMGFGKWLRHITGYLLLFPASAILIFLALAFVLNPGLKDPSDTSSTFFPPLLGVPGTSGNLGVLVAFGLIMLLPEALEMIKEAMQIKGNSRVSSAIAGGFGRGVGPTKALGGVGGQLFGKDKDGQPRAARAYIQNKWNHQTRDGSGFMKSMISKPVRIWRNTSEKQQITALQNEEQNRHRINQTANTNYQSTLAYRGREEAAAQAAQILKRGYSVDYINKFLQGKGWEQDTIDNNKKIQEAIHGKNTAPVTDDNITHVPTSNPTTSSTATHPLSSSPSSTTTHTGTTGTIGGSSIPHTTTTPTVSTPLHRVGNDLVKQNTDGTPMIVMTYENGDKNFRSKEAPDNDRLYDAWQLTGWLSRHNYTL